MTDEQIKQNAEAYARRVAESHIIEKRPAYFAAFNAFISGAHSRDEEIKELNARIVKLMCERDSIKSESEYLINKLRNPWISVDERLPEKAIGLYELEEDEQHKMILFRTATGKIFRGYLDAEEIWRAFTVPFKGAYPIDAITWSRIMVTHWMPIPKV